MSERELHHYVIALGSNRGHHRHGAPRSVLTAALAALDHDGLHLLRASPMVASRPLGPSLRTYANDALGAGLVETALGTAQDFRAQRLPGLGDVGRDGR